LDDQDNLYYTDFHDRLIKMMDVNGTITSRQPGLLLTEQVYGLFVDHQKNLYILTSTALNGKKRLNDPNAVYKVLPDDTVIHIAGNGGSDYFPDGTNALDTPLSLGPFGQGEGMEMDDVGNLYFVNAGFNSILKLTPEGQFFTFAGSFTDRSEGQLAIKVPMLPKDLAVNALGDLYILDIVSNRIRKMQADGTLVTAAGNGNNSPASSWPEGRGDGGLATQAYLYHPAQIRLDSSDNLFILQRDGLGPDTARKVSPDGTISSVPVDSVAWDTQDSLGNHFFIDPILGRNKVFKGAGEPPSVLRGDVDQNQQLTINDVLLALRVLVGIGSLSSESLEAADYNGDGQFRIGDVNAILRKVVGL
jgi:hypothetical protein